MLYSEKNSKKQRRKKQRRKRKRDTRSCTTATTSPALPSVHTLANVMAPLALHQHTFKLDAAARERSLRHMGDTYVLHGLHARLARGSPITLGLLVSSVAQNGGCLNQPQRRCMEYRGSKRGCRTVMRFGRSERDCGSSKGFAVRVFEAINA